MLENIKQKTFCVVFALFLLLSAGCATKARVELTDNDYVHAKSDILYRGVVSSAFYGQGWSFGHKMRGTHESTSKFVLKTSEGHPDNPISMAKRKGVSPVFGVIDVRSQYLDRGFFEDITRDSHPFYSSPNIKASDGDLVDFWFILFI